MGRGHADDALGIPLEHLTGEIRRNLFVITGNEQVRSDAVGALPRVRDGTLGSLRLHQIHAAGVCVGISWTVIGLLSQHLIQVTVIQKFDFSSSIFECTRIGHRLTQYGFFDPAVHLFQRLLEVRMVGHRRLDFNTV